MVPLGKLVIAASYSQLYCYPTLRVSPTLSLRLCYSFLSAFLLTYLISWICTPHDHYDFGKIEDDSTIECIFMFSHV